MSGRLSLVDTRNRLTYAPEEQQHKVINTGNNMKTGKNQVPDFSSQNNFFLIFLLRLIKFPSELYRIKAKLLRTDYALPPGRCWWPLTVRQRKPVAVDGLGSRVQLAADSPSQQRRNLAVTEREEQRGTAAGNLVFVFLT